jgi:hypothetical protein
VHREIKKNLVTANLSRAGGMVGQTGIANRRAAKTHQLSAVENVTACMAPP